MVVVDSVVMVVGSKIVVVVAVVSIGVEADASIVVVAVIGSALVVVVATVTDDSIGSGDAVVVCSDEGWADGVGIRV